MINYPLRRKTFFEKLPSNSIAVLVSAKEAFRTNDQNYPYHQDANFLYMTGFEEPSSVAVFIKEENHERYILFCRKRNFAEEQWVGVRAGIKGAVDDFGADEAYPIEELDEKMLGFLSCKKRLYVAFGNSLDTHQKIHQWLSHIRGQVRRGNNLLSEIYNVEDILHEMRAIKSDEEIVLMKQAAKINIEAFKKAMKECKPGMYEYELASIVETTYRQHGCKALAFETIVAGGEKACVLHNEDLSSQLKNGDLVLIDAGCEYQHYTSDITRTFPVNKKFSGEQKAIYELVLEAQKSGIDQLHPGNAYYACQKAAIRKITEGLCELGLMKGDVDNLIEQEKYRDFYMHNFGHWMGIDVHDYAFYKIDGEWRVLLPGMVLSAEPGIYIRPGLEGVDQRWWGIGIRIEDDVLITQNGHDILTDDLPKTIAEIEK